MSDEQEHKEEKLPVEFITHRENGMPEKQEDIGKKDGLENVSLIGPTEDKRNIEDIEKKDCLKYFTLI